MILNRAIKMRIYPNDEQRHKIDVTLSHCRYIYNKMLERNTVIYKRRKEHLNYYAMQNLLPEMKNYLPWLKEAGTITMVWTQVFNLSCDFTESGENGFSTTYCGYPYIFKIYVYWKCLENIENEQLNIKSIFNLILMASLVMNYIARQR